MRDQKNTINVQKFQNSNNIKKSNACTHTRKMRQHNTKVNNLKAKATIVISYVYIYYQIF